MSPAIALSVSNTAKPQTESTLSPVSSWTSPEPLIARVRAYDPDCDADLLRRAFEFSLTSHGTQLRASGEPYFSHPVEVANILADMRLDTESIATALLHDTLEDTLATPDKIEQLFGSQVLRLVDGVTKLSRIEIQSEQLKQAENFRKFVLAMSRDIRVLLVKLADRLHNMRTLRFLSAPEKRQRIARETMEIYAPLAERMGIKQMQEELEDLAFLELHSDERAAILGHLGQLRQEGSGLISRVINELRRTLQDGGVQAEVAGREKTPWSIWRKMQRKNVAFEQLSDIMAFRIMVDSVGECYQSLGAIHSHYSVVPGRFKDYISTPKPNHYQSLHTTVVGPEKRRVEIQIRTRAMHEIAELGIAAHWAYKHGDEAREGRQYRWLRELLEILEHAGKPEEFLEHTKLELFQDEVFCFTPKGDLIVLPRGSTLIDFAYAVHSRIGDSCAGAKVNSRMVPLRTALRNGDMVEIVTSKTQNPSPEWERFVVTGRARSRIRRFVRQKQRHEYIALGRGLLDRLASQEHKDISDKALEPLLKQFQSATVEDLYANIGASLQSPREVFYTLFPDTRPRPVEKLPSVSHKITHAKSEPAKVPNGKKATPSPLLLRGLIPGMAIHFARCCHPLPGDPIVGIVTTGKGVTIHTSDCGTLDSFSQSPERWIDVAWEDQNGRPAKMVGRLNMILANQPNSLAAVTASIGKHNGNIINFKITNRASDFFELLLDIEVENVKHLNNVTAALRSLSAVCSVDRRRGR
ncbi:MAG: bifunctional (p)ppGpp synthetase/guanosine-3',5'-bis(diphosphate) 3'-pyrophosphohydrolase [Alphaproteobacteria bacterium]|nr:MAG: bifunctional (p)ppGpp synthetase/guanosine-3',5'-bis(diphosphate) 3'-pyrophosphohydrolase [Alphaproteobacteria bacterium]